MNAERSQRRAWLREVVIGLGRALTQIEAQRVEDAWRDYNLQRRSGRVAGPFPSDFVKLFGGR